MTRFVRSAALVLFGAVMAPAQIERFELAEKEGVSRFTLRAHSVTSLDLLSRIGESAGLRLVITGGAGTTRALDDEKVDVAVLDATIDDLVAQLAGAAGFRGVLDRTTQAILVSAPAESGDAASQDWRRSRAIDAMYSAFGGDSSPEREAKFLLDTARLQVAAGRYDEALGAFDRFVANHKSRSNLAARACLDGARCALLSDRPDDAVRLTDTFLTEWPRHELHGKARLIHAEALVARKEILPAMLMLESIVGMTNHAAFADRDVLIAEIFLADMQHDLGQNEKALAILGEIDYRHDSFANPDLQGQIPFFKGLCKRGAGQAHAAVQELRLAALTCPTPELKVRALRAQAETLLEIDSPFEALAALLVAIKLAADEETRAGLHRLEARALADLNLDQKAIEVLLGLLAPEAIAAMPEGARKGFISAAVGDLAQILFAIRDWERAIQAFEEVRRREVAVPEVSWMIARCHFAAGRPREALEEIRELVKFAPDERAVIEYRRLEGDCWERLGLHERAVRAWTEGDK